MKRCPAHRHDGFSLSSFSISRSPAPSKAWHNGLLYNMIGMGERRRRSWEKNESSRSRSWNFFFSYAAMFYFSSHPPMTSCFSPLLVRVDSLISRHGIDVISAYCKEFILLQHYSFLLWMVSRIHNWNRFRALVGISRFRSGRSQGQGLNRNSISVAQWKIRKLPDDSVALQPSFPRKDVPHRAERVSGMFSRQPFDIQINSQPNNKLTQHINSSE